MTKSAWHERVQGEVVRAGHHLGWKPTLEARGEGWVADVLLEANGRRIIVEVQGQVALPREQARHQAYVRAGYEVWWLCRRLPARWMPREDMPLFEVRVTGEGVLVATSGRSRSRWIPLITWMEAIGGGRLVFAPRLRVAVRQHLPIALLPVACWRCGSLYSIWAIAEWEGKRPLSPCGQPIGDMPPFVDDFRPETRPPVVAAIRRWFNDAPYPLARVEERFSRTAETAYRGFVCPHCGALFGTWYVEHRIVEILAGETRSVIREIEVSLDRVWTIPEAHWCLPVGENTHCHRLPAVPVERLGG